MVDSRRLTVLIKVNDEFIEVRIGGCIHLQIADLLGVELSIAGHTIPVTRHNAIQGVPDHAKALKFGQQM